MIAVVAMICVAVFVAFFMPLEVKEKPVEAKSPKYNAQMKKLWQVAQTSMKEHKPSRAEKALLTILKFDEKNAAAYNRLGILYAKSQKFDEAVECFEIAQSLDNNPASIHNAGLIYLETGAYEKAEMAFLQAIELEGDVPARFMALAKTEEKLGRPKKAIEALENAYELDPSVSTLRQILAIYENLGDTEAATATTARIEERIAEDNLVKQKRARRIMRGNRAVSNKSVTNKSASSNKGASNNKVASSTKAVVSNSSAGGKSVFSRKRVADGKVTTKPVNKTASRFGVRAVTRRKRI